MRVTGLMEVPPTIKLKDVTLMLESNQRIIRHKVGLLNLAEELGNVPRARKLMGMSRDTWRRAARLRLPQPSCTFTNTSTLSECP